MTSTWYPKHPRMKMVVSVGWVSPNIHYIKSGCSGFQLISIALSLTWETTSINMSNIISVNLCEIMIFQPPSNTWKKSIISGLFDLLHQHHPRLCFFFETFSTSPETWFVHLFLAFFDCISMKTRQFWENKNTIEPTGSIGSMVCLPTNWPSTINQMYQNMPWILGITLFWGLNMCFLFSPGQNVGLQQIHPEFPWAPRHTKRR